MVDLVRKNAANGGSGEISSEQRGSFSTTWTDNGTGPGTSASVTIQLHRVGDFVKAYIPAFSLTTGSGSPNRLDTNTDLPTWAKPLVNMRVHSGEILAAGATAIEIAEWVIETSGNIVLRRTNTGNSFGASGSAGLATPTVITWYVGT